LNAAARLTLTGAGDEVQPQRLAAQRRAVLDYLRGRVLLQFEGGTQCPAADEVLQARRDHVVVQLGFRCPRLGRPLVYRVTLFHEIDPAARHVVTVDGDERRLGLLGVANPVMQLSGVRAGLGETVWHYVVAGIEHIAIGYDHIAFLLAVIVLGRRFWPLFAAVTAFTVAHSITLTLAVLEWVVLPSRIVEVLIAASIVYVAVENFFVRDIRRRWWLTFVFGLVHGFGFASVLREHGIPDHALIPALAAFNVGVEVGQILVVALAVFAWRAAFALGERAGLRADASQQRRASLAVSAGVLLLGLYWLGERLLA
jgi:hydrogenase/urease accessory protein HupE